MHTSTTRIGSHTVRVLDRQLVLTESVSGMTSPENRSAAGRADPKERNSKTNKRPLGASSQPAAITHKLATRAEACVRTCREAGLSTIRPVAIGPTIETGIYYPISPERSVVMLPAGADPTRSSTGRFMVPRHVRRRLRAAIAAGVDFDRVYVAHELMGTPHGSEARVLSIQDAVKVVPAAPAAPMATLSHSALQAIAAGTRRTASAMGNAVAAMAVVAIDPVLLGVIIDDTDPEMGVWFAIDSWVW